jgi:hypothetical protein
MVRSILGVIASLIAMAILVSVLSVALWFVLGVDGVLKPATFDAMPVLTIWSVLAAFIGALFGGWMCLKISKSRTAVLVFAILAILLGLLNATMQQGKPTPGPREPGLSVFDAIQKRKEPIWFTLLVPVIGCAGILLGGRGFSKPKPAPDAETPP